MAEPEDAYDRPATPTRSRSRTMHQRVSLNIGDVIGNTFSTIVRTPMLIVLAIVVLAIPIAWRLVLANEAWKAGPRTLKEAADLPEDFEFLGMNSAEPMRFVADVEARGGVLYGPVEILLGLLLQCMLIYAVFRALQGRPGGLGRAVSAGFSRFLPVLGTGIIIWLLLFLAMFAGGMIGGLLGIVGGTTGGLIMAGIGGGVAMAVILMVTFVSIVACVVERLGPGRSIARSAWLTKGARWKIFAITLFVTLLGYGVNHLFQVISPAWPSSLASGLAIVAAASVLEMLVALVSAVLAVVVYRDLRVAKEDVEVDELVRVFE